MWAIAAHADPAKWRREEAHGARKRCRSNIKNFQTNTEGWLVVPADSLILLSSLARIVTPAAHVVTN